MCVRVTGASFLHGYHSDALLHCGISDTLCRVYNFDEHGPTCAEVWEEAVCVPVTHLCDQATSIPACEFDARLQEWHTLFATSHEPYDGISNNCFDYATRGVSHMMRMSPPLTKFSVAKVLEPAMVGAALYIDIIKTLLYHDRPYVRLRHFLHFHAHTLAFITTHGTYTCDVCACVLDGGTEPRWRCSYCDVDACAHCAAAMSEGTAGAATTGIVVLAATAHFAATTPSPSLPSVSVLSESTTT